MSPTSFLILFADQVAKNGRFLKVPDFDRLPWWTRQEILVLIQGKRVVEAGAEDPEVETLFDSGKKCGGRGWAVFDFEP
ncbi:unnamed protein product [Cuscuta campestris]|uniref:Uncharacterized protein n=1 Tax=Cuscuta campestris TaxID=132261 RepID=A0A484KB66_9ASTE|nr:unnamed protein product [Cuscuta campestris]